MVPEHQIQLSEKWLKGDGCLKSLEEGFATRTIGQRVEIALTDILAGLDAAENTGPAYENGVNDDAGLLCLRDSGIDIRTVTLVTEAIKTVGEEQNFSPRASDGPAKRQ